MGASMAPASSRGAIPPTDPKEAELLAAIRAHPLPEHVAVIMDGNGRWATRRGLPRMAGHREGVKAARRVVTAAATLGLRYLTLFAFSSENWTRPEKEVSTLMRLLETSIEDELPELERRNVRLRVLGRPHRVPSGVQRGLAREVRAGKLDPEEISEKHVAQALYTADVPDPDLLIRTSGEMRVSNFLLWQIAYTELWITP